MNNDFGGFTYSLNHKIGGIDLTIGGQLNFGNRPNGSNWQNPKLQSEYGSLSNIYYLELKRYF